MPVAREASPRTRGWTATYIRDTRCIRGFPAHAGMDPQGWPRLLVRGRLPRARGDGPEKDKAVRAKSLASPRTRGWTPDAHLETLRQKGFPAHAGMDPRHAVDLLLLPRLPRARGDGPLSLTVPVSSFRASPRTRGWTQYPPLNSAPPHGFPAHAGMDPDYKGRTCYMSELPRARGDGPGRAYWLEGAGMASPRTRGWTRQGDGVALPHRGFPAHAGMDPRPRLWPLERSGLPRARGDGPR